MADSYVLTLPDEILIRILCYLDTYDLLNYCEAYPEHSYFCYERHVISNINLHRKFQLNLPLNNLTKKIDVNYVTVFNVNGVYWIPAEELRTCIKKIHNLESLYVLDTKLFISEKDSSCMASLPQDKDPELWTFDQNYRLCKSVLSDLKVVNDLAERGVELIQNYYNCLMRNEEYKQYLLQVVDEHRKKLSNVTKNKIITAYAEKIKKKSFTHMCLKL